jgi:putative nucleotidyltransferase with HDIG domain
VIAKSDQKLYEAKRQRGKARSSIEKIDKPTPMGAFGMLDGLVTAIDKKDHYTRRHSDEVAEFALMIGEALGLKEESLRTLRVAAILHDVGKIGIPEHIIEKRGDLDKHEILMMQQHPVLGEFMIRDIPNRAEVVAAVAAHHERYDGKGYPRGIKGDEIPLFAKIIAVADAFSTMTSDQPYSQGLMPEAAQAELDRVAGSQLDPELVHVFLNALCTRGHDVFAAS